jgi:hypothetical protein
MTGLGLAPWRVLDTYSKKRSSAIDMLNSLCTTGIAKIWWYKRRTHALRRKAGLPPLFDDDDLPDPQYDPKYAHVLSEKEQRDLLYRTSWSALDCYSLSQQRAIRADEVYGITNVVSPARHRDTSSQPCASRSPSSATDGASAGFPYRLRPCHLRPQCRQLYLPSDARRLHVVDGPVRHPKMYPLPTHDSLIVRCSFNRPAWSTGSLIPFAFLCGILSGVLIWRGGELTKRTAHVEEYLCAALAARAKERKSLAAPIPGAVEDAEKDKENDRIGLGKGMHPALGGMASLPRTAASGSAEELERPLQSEG